jgi:hypothetical protein
MGSDTGPRLQNRSGKGRNQIQVIWPQIQRHLSGLGLLDTDKENETPAVQTR